MRLPFRKTLPYVCALLMSGAAVHAAPVTWVDWVSADSTIATGTIGAVTVKFTGVLDPPAQTYADAGVINWWSVTAPYTSPTVDNGPWPSEIIRLIGGAAAGIQTLTFSTPVADPILAIFSLGQGGIEVSYDFDADFIILKSAPGYFGDGDLLRPSPGVLSGTEANGLIQFQGTFTSISWTIPIAEDWHGFTVAVPDTNTASVDAPVPEPSTLTAGFIGLGAMVVLYRRRRYNPAV